MVLTSTKLGRSPVTKLFDAKAANVNSSSLTIQCQRYSDELGAVQLDLSAAPGAMTGGLTVEGRLRPDLPWAMIADPTTHTQLDATTFSASVLSQIATNIAIMPNMRFTWTAASAGSQTVTASLME